MAPKTCLIVRVILGVLVLAVFLAGAPRVHAASPCCTITNVDQKTGTVTANETATSRVFTFKVTDAKLLSSLKIGQGVYANFTTKQVSLNGTQACCAITNLDLRVRVQPPGRTTTGSQTPNGSSGSTTTTSCPVGSGFYGPTCVPCPCSNGPNARCSDGPNGTGVCTCSAGFNGYKCQYSNATTCNNHGTADYNGGCTCAAAYSGAHCEIKN